MLLILYYFPLSSKGDKGGFRPKKIPEHAF